MDYFVWLYIYKKLVCSNFIYFHVGVLLSQYYLLMRLSSPLYTLDYSFID